MPSDLKNSVNARESPPPAESPITMIFLSGQASQNALYIDVIVSEQ